MPGHRPGECGRRIAGRDACPTQEGGHPPQWGVSALPLSGCVPRYKNALAWLSALRADVRPNLSRSKIELSALPLPCAFCRSRMRQNRAPAGPENAAGRLGGLPSLPMSVSVLSFSIPREKCHSATFAHKWPNTAFQPFKGVRMSPSPQTRHKPPHNADMGVPVWGCGLRRGLQPLAE